MMPDIASITSVFNFIGALALAFLCGAFTVLLIVLYIVNEYSKHLPFFVEKPKVQYQKVQLGDLLHKNLHSDGGNSLLDEKESCRFLNMLFAFIFREWRDTNQLRKWVLKKVNIEFMEFMETKTASRLLQGIKIHDVKLGTNFPVFHSAHIKEPYSFTDNELPEQVTLELDMEYHGGFYLAIDVDLVFGKTAFLAVQVTYLKGKLRLQYSRSPCTHWSVTFVDEPDIRFHIETSFETRQLPQLTSLIVNQIRRTIRRKHTLPHYKMRYTPFFSFLHPEISPFEGFISDIPVQPTVLEVCIAACTRLLISSRGEKERNAESPNYVIFATVSVNVESCIGKSLFRLRPMGSPKPDLPESRNTRSLSTDTGTPRSVQTSARTTASSGVRTSTTFDSLQRSLGLRKDSTDKAQKSELINQKATSSGSMRNKLKETATKESSNTLPEAEKKPSKNRELSTASAAYVMVAMNFGATLREEISQKDGEKSVVVGNITEHCVTGQSGMKDGDIIIELNGEAISSLSQAITKIEKIRASRGSFRFKVRRSKADTETLIDTPLQELQGKSTASLDDTESDHSDVDLADYQDFVNISLQVAEMHSNTTQKSSTGPAEENSRTHSHSMSSLNDNTYSPYMTLVSTPKKEQNNLTTPARESSQDRNPKKLFPVKRTNAHRSRSESPPLLRNSAPLPKSVSSSTNRLSTSSLNENKRPARSNSQQRAENRKASPSSSHRLRAMASPSSSMVPQDLLSNEADKVGLSFTDQSDQPIPFPIPSRPSENLSFARVDDELDTQLFKTSLVNSNQREYSWKNDTFSFNVKEKHRYLNVRYWTQLVGKKGIIKTRSPQIVACLSIPICELEIFCRAVTSRTMTRCFRLCPPNELPNDYKWFMSDPVSSRSSFREEYCFGDSTLTVSIVPKPSNKNNSNHCYRQPETTEKFIPGDNTNGAISKELVDRMNRRTGSNYLLSAATDKARKLLVSRETQTSSSKVLPPGNVSTPSSTTSCPEPDTATAADPKDESAKEKSLTLSQMIKGFISGRKEMSEVKHDSVVEESASDLKEVVPVETETSKISGDIHPKTENAPDKNSPHQFELARFSSTMKCAFCNNKIWSKSGLQCKLCLSVCHKRCVERFKSDINCPGLEKEHPEGTVKRDECASDNDNDSSSDNSNPLPAIAVDFRNKILDLAKNAKEGNEQKDIKVKKNFPRAKNSEDMLAVNAKEMGRDLHRDLPMSERRVVLENQLQKVEDQLHSEIDEKESLLQEQRNSQGLSKNWKKIEKKIGKSDERLQALALLLLHYRAGLEDCDFESNEAEVVDEHSEITAEAECKVDDSNVESPMMNESIPS